jgi:hypothetical protein
VVNGGARGHAKATRATPRGGTPRAGGRGCAGAAPGATTGAAPVAEPPGAAPGAGGRAGAAPGHAGRAGEGGVRAAAEQGEQGGAAPPANREGRGARVQGKERARAGGEEEGEGERGEGKGSSPRGPNSGNRRFQSLGHHGEREVEEGEGGCCAGNPNEREERRGRMGGWAPGARRAGPDWVWLGPSHFADRNSRHA